MIDPNNKNEYQMLTKCIDLENWSVLQHPLYGKMHQSFELWLIPGLVAEEKSALRRGKAVVEIPLSVAHSSNGHSNSTMMDV